jgi:hypothetical protein
MGAVQELRPKAADSEKITINLGYVDLGHIDLLVRQSVARKTLDLGLHTYTRADLELARDRGVPLDINVLGLAVIGRDVSAELARAAIASVSVLGALHASAEVKSALADRTR